MKNLISLTATEFDHNFHGSKLIEPHNNSDYTIHSVDVFNHIVINGEEHTAVYQTGNSYLSGDYNRPSPKLELSNHTDGSGTSKLIYLMSYTQKEEIEKLVDDDLVEFCESLSEYDTFKIYSVEELIELRDLISKNEKNAAAYFEGLELPDAEPEPETDDQE